MSKSYIIDFCCPADAWPYQFRSEQDYAYLRFFVRDLHRGNQFSEREYSITAYNERYLDKILENPQGEFQRFFLVYRETGPKPLESFFDKLVDINYKPSILPNSLERYAAISSEEQFWHGSTMHNRFKGDVEVKYQFEQGINSVSRNTLFDERVVVEWTWDYYGTQETFRGYWYVISLSFLKLRLDEIDPYYRRFAYICPDFNASAFEAELELYAKLLTRIDPQYRKIYLHYHCEVDGDVNTYKR
jgi:hypothetical protein